MMPLISSLPPFTVGGVDGLLVKLVHTMFNVLNRSAHIPETLSSEGNDFLKRCLQKNTRNMDDRSSA
ncbi:hypothetical protein Tco_1287845, partial [Tanacetum coccineum]